MQQSSIGISASVVAAAVVACAWFSSGGQAAGSWAPLGLLSEVRSGATATRLDDGRVLIAGGANQDSVLRSAEIVHPSGAVRVITSLHTPRTGHTATRLADGRVLVTGGTTLRRVPVSTAEIFDPVTSVWTLVEMRAARSQHTATFVSEAGQVVLAGGWRDGVPLDEIEVFDPRTDTFAAFERPLAIARLRHSAVALSHGRVMVAGGSDGILALASTEIIDLTTRSVTAGPTLQLARTDFTATELPDGDVLIVGGSNGATELASAERLVASSGQFVPAGEVWGPRQGHEAVRLPHNNGVLLVGGTVAGQAQPITEIYLPASGRFKHMGVTYGAHTDGAVDATGTDGVVLAAGGVGTAEAETFRFPTVRTDKAVYRTGELLTIVGAGWVPGEPASVTVAAEGQAAGGSVRSTTADEFGYLVVRAPAPTQTGFPARWTVTVRAASAEAQSQVSGHVPGLNGPVAVVSQQVR